jgi:Tol biopolymer transport system component
LSIVKTIALLVAAAAGVAGANGAQFKAKPIVFYGSNTQKLYLVVSGSAPKLLTRGRLHGGDARWSRDHRWLAFSGWTHTPSSSLFGTCIFVMRADGRFLRRVTPESNNVFDRTPDWSPDGKQILFARDAESTGAKSDIYVVSARGGAPRLLNKDGSFPRWSPSGRTIAFARVTNQGLDRGICVMDAAGSGVRRLTSSWWNGLDWSPDGSRLLFSSRSDVFSVGVNGSSAPQPLTRGGSPVYSPDGRKILFVRYGSHPPRLYLANANGTHVRRWPLLLAAEYPDW